MTTTPDQPAPARKSFSAAKPSAMTADQLAALHDADQLSVVTGVHLMQGLGHRPTQGFWAEAWQQVIRRPGAVAGLTWVAIIAFFACFSPLIASGHPLIMREVTETGMSAGKVTYPLFEHLTSMDVLLVIAGVLAPLYILGPWGGPRSERLANALGIAVQGGIAVVIKELIVSLTTARDATDWIRANEGAWWFIPAALAVAGVLAAGARFLPRIAGAGPRLFFGSIAFAIAAGVAIGLAIHEPLGLSTAGAIMLGIVGAFAFAAFAATPFLDREATIAWVVAVGAGVVIALVSNWTWRPPLEQFDYRAREARGEITTVYTLLPLSPQEGDSARNLKPQWSTLLTPVIDEFVRTAVRQRDLPGFKDDPRWGVPQDEKYPAMADIALDDSLVDAAAYLIEDAVLSTSPDALVAELREGYAAGRIKTVKDVVAMLHAQHSPVFVLGTDSLGQDVLSQMLHACRLSISIGLVSTGIAVVIGVAMGALMGYFGGWVDLLLYRVVEIFMAIPVLFLLIVAAAVLPRNTYVMMAIIGCVTWTYPARYIRAEFYKLRGQDFVQSARAVGLPLRSVLFKHMLPNGVTPVLVEASFLIAAAILVEAVLSFLGLGPANQASWGRLLSDATNQVGTFIPWLAIFPGGAIFLTVLSYNLIGEALRDAIDPKLKKARV